MTDEWEGVCKEGDVQQIRIWSWTQFLTDFDGEKRVFILEYTHSIHRPRATVAGLLLREEIGVQWSGVGNSHSPRASPRQIF